MTVTVHRRVGTLYPDERADMVLYIDGPPGEVEVLWTAFRDEASWDFVVGADGRIVLKPLNARKRRTAQGVVG